MKTWIVTVGAVLLLMSAPALADACLDGLKKIDTRLALEIEIAEELLDQIKKLRAAGEKLHNEGRHDRAARRLKMALKIHAQSVKEAEAKAARE